MVMCNFIFVKLFVLENKFFFAVMQKIVFLKKIDHYYNVQCHEESSFLMKNIVLFTSAFIAQLRFNLFNSISILHESMQKVFLTSICTKRAYFNILKEAACKKLHKCHANSWPAFFILIKRKPLRHPTIHRNNCMVHLGL